METDRLVRDASIKWISPIELRRLLKGLCASCVGDPVEDELFGIDGMEKNALRRSWFCV